MKKLIIIVILGWFVFSSKASVTAYFNYGVFNVPTGSPFIETYLTVIGKSIKHIPVNGGIQGSVNVKVLITKGGELYTGDNYNLLSPPSLKCQDPMFESWHYPPLYAWTPSTHKQQRKKKKNTPKAFCSRFLLFLTYIYLLFLIFLFKQVLENNKEFFGFKFSQ